MSLRRTGNAEFVDVSNACEVEHCDRPAVWKIEPVKPDADCDTVVCCQDCVAEVLAGTSIYVEKHTITWLEYEGERT